MTDGLKKIELNTPASTNPAPMKKRQFQWKKLALPAGILMGLLVILGIMLLPLGGVLAKARVVETNARGVADAFKTQDLAAAKERLAITKSAMEDLKGEYRKLKPLTFVPIVGSYVSDGEHGVNAGVAAVLAGEKAIEALEPNADLLGLSGKSRFVEGSADERIQTAVKTMSALTPKINEMAVHVDTIRKELAYIDPNRYPREIGKTVIRERIASAKTVIENAANLFVNAQPLLLNLPKMLGEPEDRTYLVLFQNDKELRPTGGFMTAYAIFRISRGKMVLIKSDDIYSLDNALRTKFPATREITTFHKLVYNLNIRDSNLSPDFAVSMAQFEAMYDNVAGREAIDGIWAVDTHVLVEALRILGPITLYDADFKKNREFSAEIDARCDCPKAVYELEDSSSRPVGFVRAERKALLGDLLQQTIQKALGVSPSQYWGQLFQMLISEINKKHVLSYFHEPEAQKGAESFNMAGRIITVSETATRLAYTEGNGWDYLHINNSNMAGAKANMFTSQKYIKDVTISGDTITTKLTLEYKNPYPGSDCGLESGGLCLNAPLRNWVRVYVPRGSKLTESRGSQSPGDGKPTDMTIYDALEKTVFEGFLIVNPLGTARLDITYTSPVKSSDGKYRLLIQKQPGTDGDEYLLKLGGRDRKKWVLETDTEVTL